MAKEKVMVSEQYLQDIANSIRTKLKTEDKYKPSEFSSKIDEMNVTPKIEKGLIITACDDTGAVTEIKLVNMTEVPSWCFGTYEYNNSVYNNYVNKNLKNIIFTENTTNIKSSAFRNCTNLALTELPDTITTIGSSAFYNCPNLDLAKLPDDLTSIGSKCFYGCKKVTLSSIPLGLTQLADGAFENCSYLGLYKLHSNITFIGPRAFRQCGLTQMVDTVSENITEIGTQAYAYNGALTRIIFRALTPPTLGTDVFTASGIVNYSSACIYVPDESVEAYKTATNWSRYASKIKPISELEVSE